MSTLSGCADYRLWRMRAKVWIMKNHAAENKQTANNEPTNYPDCEYKLSLCIFVTPYIPDRQLVLSFAKC